jgi:hypothetical protein
MKFPYDNDIVYLCYGLPYTYTDLKSYCKSWALKGGKFIQISTLCQSFGGRSCPVLTITNPNSRCEKQIVFFTARCHPGESNSSIVLHGAIDFLLSMSPMSCYLLDRFIFRIVPMVCIDGVIEGNYRICLCGSDLNRMWISPDPVRHPVVYCTKALLKRGPPVLYIDFHGHSRLNGTFAYGCPNAAHLEVKGRERMFPKILSILSDAFTYGKCTFSMPFGRMSASRCVVRQELGVFESFTIETSFSGIACGRLATVLYDERIWKELGCKMCEGIYHLLGPGGSRIRSLAERELGLVTEKLGLGMTTDFRKSENWKDGWKKGDEGAAHPVISRPDLSRGKVGKSMLFGSQGRSIIGHKALLVTSFG